MNLVLWFLVVFCLGMCLGSSMSTSEDKLGQFAGLVLLVATALVALGRWLAFLP